LLEGTPTVAQFVVDGEYFDCRLMLAGKQLELGLIYEMPVVFLRADLVLEKLTEGKAFVLWERKDIADGEVVRVLGRTGA